MRGRRAPAGVRGALARARAGICGALARARGGICGALARALAAFALLAACAAPVLADDATGEPKPFEGFDGVPGEWTEVLNGYVHDPKTFGPRLIAIERQSGGTLPPAFQMATADAYLRAGNRRAAERVFEQSLAQDAGYPWTEFANLAMGTIRLANGDDGGAQVFFGRVTESPEASAQALGNLGMGAALSASGRFAEAKEAFSATASSETVDENVRLAGRFGSALALHGAGDFAGAARAFDELAQIDPDGPVGQDARYAAARARLAMGDRNGGAAALRDLIDTCDPRRGAGRAPRALRNLDARAMGRNWLRNYRRTGWSELGGGGGAMYSIGGCALARSTLRALEREDAGGEAIRPVAAPAAVARESAAAPRSSSHAAAPAAAPDTSGAGWTPVVSMLVAASALIVLWRTLARGGKRR